MIAGLLTDGYRNLVKAASLCASVADQISIELAGVGPVAPLHLRARVHGGADLPGFLKVGAQSAQDLYGAIIRAGKKPEDIRAVLDFGCGCGRTIIWLHKLLPARWFGTDIDPDAIGWCQDHLQYAAFGVNAPEPPLPYPDGVFDLVYGISVLTHLDERMQFLWLAELRRVTRPGGLVLLTVHGDQHLQSLAPRWQEEVRERGIAFVPTRIWRSVFPEWYQNTYHSPEYVKREFSRFFTVRDYLPGGLNGHQDLVTLERPVDPATAAAGITNRYKGQNNANDSGGSANGTIVGQLTYVPGKIGQAFCFPGHPGNYIDLGTRASLSGSGDFTISAIIKTTADGVIITQRDRANFDGEFVFSVGGRFVNTPGKLSLDEFSHGTGKQSFVSTSTVNNGNFHYVVVVRHASGTVEFFIDGVLDSSTPGTPVPLNPTLNTYIGEDVRDGVKPFNGLIEDVQIYNGTALSAAQIKTLSDNIMATIK